MKLIVLTDQVAAELNLTRHARIRVRRDIDTAYYDARRVKRALRRYRLTGRRIHTNWCNRHSTAVSYADVEKFWRGLSR